jgi:hypothetical protein
MTPTRRHFLEAAGATIAMGTSLTPSANANPSQNRRPKVAALASTYFYLSHGYHIVGRFLDGFEVNDAHGLHKPAFDIASLYIEQIDPKTDLGVAKAKRFGVRQSPTITDALTLGTGELAVDAVLLIAEHGDYPYNDRLQKLYPRGKYFREIMSVFEKSKKSVPVFNDKHLSYDRAEAQSMVDEAKRLKAPFMAGSSLPVTWRLPSVEVPLGLEWKEAVVASRGELDTFGFHALETLQCMVERRNLHGKPQGVKAVTCLEGNAVWKAIDEGRISKELLEAAIGKSHTQNPGDMRLNVLDWQPIKGQPRYPHGPFAFIVEYVDGFQGTAMILNGHVDDTTIAAKFEGQPIISTLMYLPAPPGANFFNPLVLRIEDFFKTGVPQYPVERTQLSGGILAAALESRFQKGKKIETPDLATIDYKAPSDSGYIRTSLTKP